MFRKNCLNFAIIRFILSPDPISTLSMAPLRLLFFSALLLLASMLQAQRLGDTLVVQTFRYSDPAPADIYRGTFQMPPRGESFQKILMSYSLKCDVSTRADRFPCGEWDYLTYTFLTDSSGVYDSALRTQSSFTVLNSSTPDSIALRRQPVYTYVEDWQKRVRYISTLSLDSAIIGAGSGTTAAPLRGDRLQGRAQYLWRAAELANAGLQGGLLTGLRLFVNSPAGEIRNYSIRIRHSALDSLSAESWERDGFSEVYRANTAFPATGWQSLYFSRPFQWDGQSNLVIEFLYDQMDAVAAGVVQADTLAWHAGLTAAGNNYYLSLDGDDHVSAGQAMQAAIRGAAPRTIEMWANARAFNGAGLFQAGSTGANDRDFTLRTLGTDDRWRIQLWGANDTDITLPNSKNEWHHYCVSYDGTSVRLYYDGQLITTRPANLNTGAVDFRFGMWAGVGGRFVGDIDEARIWNKALTPAVIAEWKDKTLSSAHPDYANLLAHYPFDEGQGVQSAAANGSAAPANLLGVPAWRRTASTAIRRDLTATTIRPRIVLEQRVAGGILLDSIRSLDSMLNAPVQVVIYGNPDGNFIIRHDAPNQPGAPTDTLVAWRANAFSYILDRNGVKRDSIAIARDTTLKRRTLQWYSNIVRFELARYITPYGINLDLGPNGTTWWFDVSDYEPLLHGPVYLEAGNNQELLDMKFHFIKGTPPRQVLRVQNVYDGNWSFDAIARGVQATPRRMKLDARAAAFRLKARTTGHGFGGPTNCAEFCNRQHSLWVDSVKRFSWWLWNECAFNPVQPQGGTWVYDRAGWCPGDAVKDYNYEVSPYVQPGREATFDYEIDTNGEAAEGNWVLRTQLISYGPPTHQLDAAIEDIIYPTRKDIHAHFNPVCGRPKIVIQNRGAQPLTSVLISYGVISGFRPCYFRWNGNLNFMESAEVELPLFNWTGAGVSNPPRFYAFVSYPNYQQDEYEANNYQEVSFNLPPQYLSGFIVNLSTNRRALENRWFITNDQGQVVRQRAFLANNTTYNDTVNLPDGCYTFVLVDQGNDGLDFFANRAQAGSGSLRLLNPNGSVLENVNPDFGGEVRRQFTVGYRLGGEYFNIPCVNITGNETELPLGEVEIFPNPAKGQFNLRWGHLPQGGPLEVRVLNVMGAAVLSQQVNAADRELNLQLDAPPGIYLVNLRAKGLNRTLRLQLN